MKKECRLAGALFSKQRNRLQREFFFVNTAIHSVFGSRLLLIFFVIKDNVDLKSIKNWKKNSIELKINKYLLD